MKNVLKKMADDVIVSEMIDYLTQNPIIRDASNQALGLREDQYTKELLETKFTERVWRLMPAIEGDFDFSDSPESAARDEFMLVQNIIDSKTAGELDVRTVGQVYK